MRRMKNDFVISHSLVNYTEALSYPAPISCYGLTLQSYSVRVLPEMRLGLRISKFINIH
jgi:hypothetical protein